jgi:hypothetical protein
VLFLLLRRGFIFCIFLLVCFPSFGQIVKLSNSKICHAPDSPFYERVKRFKRFTSLEDCLDAGGRLPQIKASSGFSKGRSNKYSRNAFGSGWADSDKDCQNTRHEVLIEQSTTTPVLSNNGCKAEHGRWVSMFTGDVITSAKLLDIDHVVPLKWAWSHGADQWSGHKREQFANDPINLIAVESSLNRAKGAQGPDEWLPPKNECQYILRFERILVKYSINTPSNIQIMVQRCLRK